VALLLVVVACGDDDEGARQRPGRPARPEPAAAHAEAQAPPDQQQIVVQSGQPEFFTPTGPTSSRTSPLRACSGAASTSWWWRTTGALRQCRPWPTEPTVNGNVYTVKLKSGLKWSDGYR